MFFFKCNVDKPIECGPIFTGTLLFKKNLLEKNKLQKLAEDECSGMFRNTYLFTGKLGIEY